MDKPIPAFYGCYLLRSTVRHGSLYVGSTPHPPRRLSQHNGKGKGGAVRTSRPNLRPWEMACIVAGFPSNIAALQFEWAWHNAHLTRHIPQHERISFATSRTKLSARTGKTRKRPGRPRTSLIDRLSNLHLLLRVPYFSKWPLELRFFNQEVFRAWQAWCDRVDADIRAGIKIFLDLSEAEVDGNQEIVATQPPTKRRKADLIGKGGVDGIDPTYDRFQNVLEKSRFLLDEDDDHKCGECQEQLDLRHDLYAICPCHNCQNISHVSCLARRFVSETESTSLVPEKGKCRSCSGSLSWVELMREATLRMYGEKEVQKLFKKKRKTNAATADDILESDDEGDEAEDEENDELTAAEFHDEVNEDDVSVTSVESSLSLTSKTSTSRKKATGNKLEIVIEDSDDDGRA